LLTVRTKFAGSIVGAYRPWTGASDVADCGVALLEFVPLGVVLLGLAAECPLEDEQLLIVRATAMPAKAAPTCRRSDRWPPRPSSRWAVPFPRPGTGMKITSSVARFARLPALRRKAMWSHLNAA
jgi:hypothetical protein